MNRVLAIGLDGASPHLVNEWAEHLPNLRHMMTRGAHGTLESVVPPRSVPAWYCFATGMNPAKIGVFGFSQRIPDTYDYTFANLTHCRAPTLWQWLNRHAVKTAVVHVPGTFPPHEIDGVLVSGWPAPLNRGNLVYTHPEAQSREIDRRLGRPFEFTSDKPMRTDNDAEMLEERLRLTQMQGDVAFWTLSEHEWDVGVVVLTATDQAAHQFWRHMEPGHPAHDPNLALHFRDALLHVYQAADAQVGRLLKLLDPEDTVLVVSDHGFGSAYRTFFLNEWLRQQGYLVLQNGGESGQMGWRSSLLGRASAPLFRLNQASPFFRRLSGPFKKRALSNLLRDEYVRFREKGLVRLSHLPVDWNRTRAYCPDEASLYLNLRGRDPAGIVNPGHEAERLIAEIMRGLQSIADPDTGTPVPVTLHRKETVFSGPFMIDAPELVVVMDGYATEVMAELGGDRLFVPAGSRSGTHTLEGILIACGPDVIPGRKLRASLMDIAPTISHMVGVPVAQESDGEVLFRMFVDDAELKLRSIRTAPAGLHVSDAELGDAYTEEELLHVEQQLRDLGYLG
jgi:predicted AlkP superfamily phosphohydrolase/phosphomutase